MLSSDNQVVYFTYKFVALSAGTSMWKSFKYICHLSTFAYHPMFFPQIKYTLFNTS